MLVFSPEALAQDIYIIAILLTVFHLPLVSLSLITSRREMPKYGMENKEYTIHFAAVCIYYFVFNSHNRIKIIIKIKKHLFKVLTFFVNCLAINIYHNIYLHLHYLLLVDGC